MSYTANYTPTTSNVEVQNVSGFLDKRNGYVIFEFDARGKDWIAGAPYPTAKIIVGIYTFVKSAINLTNLSNSWKRYRCRANVGEYYSSMENGNYDFTLSVLDENSVVARTEVALQVRIDLDLDPVEYMMTIVEEVDFGSDTTPKINFTLKDLHNKNQSMTPVITNDATGLVARILYVTFAFEGGTSTVGFASGFIPVNGVKFSESFLELDNEDGNAAKALWLEATNYAMDTPSLSGNNPYTIDLVCRNL